MIHPRTECTGACTHDQLRPPIGRTDPEVRVLAGPGAFYPAEANVPPVYLGSPDLSAPVLSFARAGQVEQLSAFPAPEITSEEEAWPDDVEVPRGVRDLQRYAETCGWVVKLQYSRGHGSHRGTGRPTALSHWIGVRMQCRASACLAVAYAVYCRPVNGKASWALHNARHVRGSLPSVAAVREWLDGGHRHPTG